ncbi:IS607 family transposase, partial [Cylindrospermopsis raciborskii CS-506_B]|nr:IS607 family transposase [Cylindrospermopsis raciborskii CS-506_B]
MDRISSKSANKLSSTFSFLPEDLTRQIQVLEAFSGANGWQ